MDGQPVLAREPPHRDVTGQGHHLHAPHQPRSRAPAGQQRDDGRSARAPAAHALGAYLLQVRALRDSTANWSVPKNRSLHGGPPEESLRWSAAPGSAPRSAPAALPLPHMARSQSGSERRRARVLPGGRGVGTGRRHDPRFFCRTSAAPRACSRAVPPPTGAGARLPPEPGGGTRRGYGFDSVFFEEPTVLKHT